MAKAVISESELCVSLAWVAYAAHLRSCRDGPSNEACDTRADLLKQLARHLKTQAVRPNISHLHCDLLPVQSL